MIPVQQINPNPPPMPPTPPGVGDPPPLPPVGGGAPPGAPGGAPATASPPTAAGPSPQPPGGAPAGPPAGAQGPTDAESAQPGDPRPRLIPGTDQTSGNIPATPQEQADLHQTLVKAGNMIHSRTSRDNVLGSLHRPGEAVAQAVGKTAAQILMTINDQKKAATGQPLDDDVLQEAARYVVPELMDIGISAGLFPIKPPPGGMASDTKGSRGDGKSTGVGLGDDDYNKQIRMAMVEAATVYGNSKLQSPDYPQLKEQAQNDWAAGVQREVQNGTANPAFMAKAKANTIGQPSQPQQSRLIPGGAAPAGAPA